MKRTFCLRLGDTVSGVYHGTPFTGELTAYDGSGYLYVDFPAPHAKPVAYGIERDRVAIAPDSPERDSLVVVAGPIARPEVREHPTHVLGGAFAVSS